MLLKKMEEKEKRDRLFREYQERKKQEEEAALAILKPGIIPNATTPNTGKKVRPCCCGSIAGWWGGAWRGRVARGDRGVWVLCWRTGMGPMEG